MSKQFDITKYNINFQSVFTVENIKHAFYEFCKLEGDSNALDFINSLMQFEEIRTDAKDELYKKIEEIISTFLKEKAPKALNIGMTSKRQILYAYEKKETSIEQLRNMLENIKEILMIELKNGIFPRFVRSDCFMSAITNHLSNNNVLSLKQNENFVFTDEDFQSINITQKDFNFCRHLSKDNFDWKLVGHKNGANWSWNAYISKTNVLSNVEIFKHAELIKASFIFNYPFETVLIAIANAQFSGKDFTATHIRNIKKDPSNRIEEDCSIFKLDISLPWPLTSRQDYVLGSAKFFEEEQEYVLIFKSCHLPEFGIQPLKKVKIEDENIILISSNSGTIIKRLDDERTMMTSTSYIDFAGWISGKINPIAIRRRANKIAKEYEELFEKYKNVDYFEYIRTTSEMNKAILMNEDLLKFLKKLPKRRARPTSFDISKYRIHFHSIFEVAEMKDAFYKFCEMEHNTEPFNFVNEVEEYEKMNALDVSEFYPKMEKIIKTFIEPKSIQEINISAKIREKLLSSFRNKEKLKLEEIKFLFKEVKELITYELCHDVFPRFVRSKLFMDTIIKFRDDSRVLSLKRQEEFTFTDEEFTTLCITKKNFDFARHISQDDFDWSLIHHGSSKDCSWNAYTNKTKYLKNVKIFKDALMLKIIVIYKFPIKAVIFGSLNTLLTGEHGKVLRFVEKDPTKSIEENSCLVLVEFTSPWPLTPRKDVLLFSSKFYEETNEFVLIHKSCHLPELGIEPLKKIKFENQTCYFISTNGGVVIKRLDDETTLVQSTMLSDPAGWFSGKAEAKVIKARIKNMVKVNAASYAKFRNTKVEDFLKNINDEGRMFINEKMVHYLTNLEKNKY